MRHEQIELVMVACRLEAEQLHPGDRPLAAAMMALAAGDPSERALETYQQARHQPAAWEALSDVDRRTAARLLLLALALPHATCDELIDVAIGAAAVGLDGQISRNGRAA